jgi:anti-sigma factor RsiW
MPVPRNLDSRGHDRFEELCALDAIGELSADELSELRRHLADCAACRELSADFSRLASDDIARAALGKRARATFEEPAGQLDEQALLSKIVARGEGELRASGRIVNDSVGSRVPLAPAAMPRGWGLVRMPKMAYAALACLLCGAAAVAGYMLRNWDVTKVLEVRSSEINAWRVRAQAAAEDGRALSASLGRAQTRERVLEKSVAGANARSARIQAQLAASQARQAVLADELAARQAELDRVGRELSAAHSDMQDKDRALAELQGRLQRVIGQTVQQEQINEDLRSRLRRAEAATGPLPSLDVGEAEAKELLGARDLHIVDVYDVGADGQTRRTYGRVYYVEKRLLVFYAFDLQDKPRNRAAVSFQAWGYQEAGDRRPESLGLFHLDDASLKRWVLKVRNPGVLAHIDAVFVSLEPPGGSTIPNGRRVLYANLAGPPNHP